MSSEQAKIIQEFKKAIQLLNSGEITLAEYAEKTLPLWEKLNKK